MSEVLACLPLGTTGEMSFSVEGGMIRPSMERTETATELISRARIFSCDPGLDLEERTAGGASDEGFCTKPRKDDPA